MIVMDSHFYETKMNEMLADTVTYKKLKNHTDDNTMKKLENLVRKYKTQLTDKECKYLTKFENKDSYIYILPKIHKSEDIKDAIKTHASEYVCLKAPSELKFRPIVSGRENATSHLNELIDGILKPLIEKTTSYIKDSADFMRYVLENNDTEEDDI